MQNLLFWNFIFVFCFYGFESRNNTIKEDPRIYDLTKCAGAGCPYTASWLSHVNLYRRLTWYMDSTKMEAASFTMSVVLFLKH